MRTENLWKKYKNEWILVEVLKESSQNQPKEVRVLAHGKNREEIYDQLLKMAKKVKHLAIIFAGKVLQEDYAAAFVLWQIVNTNSKKKI